VPANFHELLRLHNDTASTEQSPLSVFVIEALTATLQSAFEAAVFPNRFEIDEQEPLSRLAALTEQLVTSASNLPSTGISQAQEASAKAEAISIIREVSRRIRSAIQ
jgi:hypothetical protein